MEGETYEQVYNNLEQMLPGCWIAIYFVALQLKASYFVLDDYLI